MNDAEKGAKAVALHYFPGQGAPRMAAKGRGELRATILRLAEEYGIPVRTDPVLAEALYRFDEDDPIPEELYTAVAEVYAFLLRTGRSLGGAENDAAG